MENTSTSGSTSVLKEKLFFIPAVLLTIVAVVVIYAISTSGGEKNPSDELRMSDMQTISAAVRLYAAANNGVYPESLDVLVVNKFLTHAYRDPVTSVPYRYLRTAHQTFSICATIADGSNRCVSSQANK